jgi:uncharacterized protein YukE
MEITLRSLMEADPGAIRGIADRWLTVVDAIDATVGDLGADTRDIPYYWTGDDSVAAQQRVAKLRTQIGNAHLKVARTADALRKFADDVGRYQSMLRGVVDEARAGGLTIDLHSGTVTAPLTTLVADTPASVDSYAAEISEILQQAADADARTRKALEREMRDIGEHSSLPSELHYSEAMDPVGQEAFPTKTGFSQAHEWHYLHPMEKERLITEQPEVYGAAEGLPSEDRDAANRILLSREKAALIDQQALYSGTASPPPDGSGGRALPPELTVVNNRLAAIERLENRMNDTTKPKVYLVDYKPGDEENTTLGAGDPEYDNAWAGVVPPKRD